MVYSSERQGLAKVGPKQLLESALRMRSEEHTSELQSLMRISYAVFCLKKKKQQQEVTTEKQARHQTERNKNRTTHSSTQTTTTKGCKDRQNITKIETHK